MSAACLPNNATSISGPWGEGGRGGREEKKGRGGGVEGGLPIAAVTDLRDG